MAKYTKEEKQKTAIDLYFQVLQSSHNGLMELGYPNERHTLASWYRVYEQKDEVKDKGREETKLSLVYSVNQVHGAVRFSMSKGKASVRPLKL